jgi:predicted amidohydrolase
MFRAACIQFCAGRSVEDNVATASRLIADAVRGGARIVMTPEMTGLIEMDAEALRGKTRAEADDPALAALRALARELETWLLIGSLALKTREERLANRSFLIAPDGAVAARCDKIHMFDVTLANAETYRESRRYRPGCEAVVADLPWGRLGMSVCYDVRFPALYRTLAQAGAQFLSIPSAFTRPTGEAHWHVLVRARAIETGAYVFAPAQEGEHEAGRSTYGHSVIVDPWGEIVAEAASGEAVIAADIEPGRVEAARRRIPALAHDRAFEVVHEGAGAAAAARFAS